MRNVLIKRPHVFYFKIYCIYLEKNFKKSEQTLEESMNQKSYPYIISLYREIALIIIRYLEPQYTSRRAEVYSGTDSIPFFSEEGRGLISRLENVLKEHFFVLIGDDENGRSRLHYHPSSIRNLLKGLEENSDLSHIQELHNRCEALFNGIDSKESDRILGTAIQWYLNAKHRYPNETKHLGSFTVDNVEYYALIIKFDTGVYLLCINDACIKNDISKRKCLFDVRFAQNSNDTSVFAEQYALLSKKILSFNLAYDSEESLHKRNVRLALYELYVNALTNGAFDTKHASAVA